MSDGKIVIAVDVDDGQVKELDKNLSGLEGAGTKGSLGIGKIVTALGLMKIASAAINVMKSSIDGAIKRVDTLANADRVFANMGFSAQDTAQTMDSLKQSIQGLPTPLDEAVKGVQLIASSTNDVKKSQKIFSALNNGILGFGGTTEMVSNAVTQLSQSFSNGKVDAGTWNSMINSGLGPSLNALAKQMGKTAGQLKEGLSNGSISVEEFQDALINLNENGGGGLKALNVIAKDATAGIGTSIQNMKTAITRGVANIIVALDDFLKYVTGMNISEIINQIGSTFETALNGFAKGLKVVSPLFKLLFNLIKPFTPLIIGASAGLATFGTALFAMNKAKEVVKSIDALKTSFGALQALMLANPILLVISGIVALGVALVVLYKKVEWFRNAVNFIFGPIVKLVDTAFNAISSAMTKTANVFKLIFGMIGSYFTDFSGKFQELRNNLIDAIGEKAAYKVTRGLVKILSPIKDVVAAFQGLAKVAKGSFKSIGELDEFLGGAVSERTTKIIMGMGTAINKTVTAFKLGFGMIGSYFTDFSGKFQELRTQLVEALGEKTAFVIVRGMVKVLSPIKDIVTAVQGLGKVASGSFKKIGELDEFLGGAVSERTTKIIMNIGEALNGVRENVIKTGKSVKDFAGQLTSLKGLNKIAHDILPDSVFEAISTGFDAVLRNVEAVTTGFGAFKLVAKGSLSNLGDLQNYLRNTFSMETIQKIWNVGNEVKDLGQAFADAKTRVKKEFIVPLVASFEELGVKVKSVFSNAKDSVVREFLNPSISSLGEFGIKAKSAFKDIIPAVQSFGKEVVKAVASGDYSNLTNGLKDAGQSILDLKDKVLGYLVMTGIFAGLMIQEMLKTNPIFQMISDKASEFGINLQKVFGLAIDYVMNFVGKLADLKDSIVGAFKTGNLKPFVDSFVNLLPTIIGVLLGGIPGMIYAGVRLLMGLSKGMGQSIPELLNTAVEFVASFISKIVEEFPKLVTLGIDFLKNIGEGFKTGTSTALSVIGDFILGIADAFSKIPDLINTGIEMFKGLVEGFKTGSAKALTKSKSTASNVVEGLLTGIVKGIPKMIQAGIKLIDSLIKGIVSVIPVIVGYAADIVISFVDALAKETPRLVDSGIKLIVALVNGISKGIPKLMKSFIGLLESVVDSIVDNLPKYVELGIKLIKALAKGIISAKNELVKIALELVGSFVDSIVDTGLGLIDIGLGLVKNIIKGIKKYVTGMWSIGSELVESFADGLSDSKGSTSFLTDFAKIFESFAKDVAKNAPSIGSSMGKMMKGISAGIVKAVPGIVQGMENVIVAILSSLTNSLPRIIVATGELLVGIVTGLIQAIPPIVVAVGQLIVAILEAIGAVAGDIVLVGLNIVTSLINGITQGLPDLILAASNLIITFLESLGENIEAIIAAGTTLLVNFLQGIINGLPEIITTVATLITTFLTELALKLPEIIQSGVTLILAWLQGIADNIGAVITKATDVIVAFLQGITNNLPRIITAMVGVIAAFVKGIGDNIQTIVDSGMYLINKLVDGILLAQNEISLAIVKLLNGMAESIRVNAPLIGAAANNLLTAILDALPGGALIEAGFAIVGGFLSGLEQGFENVKKTVGGWATWIKENKGPISYDKKLLIDNGKAIVFGLRKGLEDSFDSVKSTIYDLTDMMKDTLGDGISFGIEANGKANLMGMDSLSKKFTMPKISAESALGIGSRMSTSPNSINTTIINNHSTKQNENIEGLISAVRDFTEKPLVTYLNNKKVSEGLGSSNDEVQGQRFRFGGRGLELNG